MSASCPLCIIVSSYLSETLDETGPGALLSMEPMPRVPETMHFAASHGNNYDIVVLWGSSMAFYGLWSIFICLLLRKYQ